jgi:hypothetical protein
MSEQLQNSAAQSATTVVVGKRFAVWKAPAPPVMTLDEARTEASKLVLEGKGTVYFVMEIVEIVEPFTRIVPFTGK